MNKKLTLFTAALYAAMLFVSIEGFADTQVLTTPELESVYGQAGISNTVENQKLIPFNTNHLNFESHDNRLLPNAKGTISALGGIDVIAAAKQTQEGMWIQNISYNAKNIEIEIDQMNAQLRMGDNIFGLMAAQGVRIRLSGTVNVQVQIE